MVATGFLYEHLADELNQAIDRGALRAGDRLPSVRRLAQERSVSVSTVLEAYLQLETHRGSPEVGALRAKARRADG
jgi:DNA-binding transcriptional MocR family regulator